MQTRSQAKFSGVATLSPGTSDSAEPTSPYSPSDSSSEPSSDAGSCVSSGRNSSVASAGRSPVTFAATSSGNSSTDTDTDSESAGSFGTVESTAGRMTALSVVLDSSPPPQPQKSGPGVGTTLGGVSNGSPKVPVTNFISFQIPKSGSAHVAFQNPVKIVEPGQVGGKSVNATAPSSSPFHCDVRNFSNKNITNIFAALKYPAGGSGGSVAQSIPDLTQTEFQPIVKVPNLRGTKSFILHGEGHHNKVIILSVPKTSLSISNSNKGKVSPVAVKPHPPTPANVNSKPSPSTPSALTNSPNINNNSSKIGNHNLSRGSYGAAGGHHNSNGVGSSALANAIKSALSCEDSAASPARKKARLASTDIIPVKISLATSELLESKPQTLKITSHQLPTSLPPQVPLGPKKTDHSLEVTKTIKTMKTSPEVVPPTKTTPTASSHPLHPHHNSSTNKKPLSLSLQVPKSLSPSLSRSASPTKSNSNGLLLSPVSLPAGGGVRGVSQTKKKPNSQGVDSSSLTNHKSEISTAKLIRKRKGEDGSSSIGSVKGASISPPTPSIRSSYEISNQGIKSAVQHSRVLLTGMAGGPVVSSSSSTDPAENVKSSRLSATSSTSLAVALGSIRTNSSVASSNGLFDNKVTQEQTLAKTSAISKSVASDTLCMWKDCCAHDANLNILEHIQTSHVAPQVKTEDGYVCLWEGCKVFNKKSSSLSWLERHVLSHSGNKPFKCIFPGCGLSFSSQGTLERHVNSHISTNGSASAANGHSSPANRKLDSSPVKAVRRKKKVFRKQRLNTGHIVDFFDKRTMEVIKHKLASVVTFEAVSPHDCTFHGEVLARRTCSNEEPCLLVHWHPEFIFPDEWIPQSKFRRTKAVPLRQIPSDKIKLLYPHMFPPERAGKAQRKWKPSSLSSSASSSAASSPLTVSLCSGDSSSSSASSTSSLLSSVSSTSFSSRRTAAEVAAEQELDDEDNDEDSSECGSSCGYPNPPRPKDSDWAILFLEGELQS